MYKIYKTATYLFLSVVLLGNIFIVNAYTGQPPILVGANLSYYKKPPVEQCNINVPAQYTTIQAAVDAANFKDTICVGPGTYNEEVLIRKSIRLSGNGNTNKSIINAQTFLPAVTIQASNVILEGFKIQGVGPVDNMPEVRDVPAVLIWEASTKVYLFSNHITSGNSGFVVRADGGQNNHFFKNNIFEGNNSPTLVQVSGAPLNPNKPSNKVDLVGNTFIGTTRADNRHPYPIVITTAATNSLIERNVFNTNGPDTRIIDYDYGSGTGGVHYNNFNSVASTKVYVSVGTLNAENNWWGDTDPSNDVVHDVIYAPFAMSPFTQYASYPVISCFAVVCDNFNFYSNGSIVGQGGWIDRVNGGVFSILDFEGSSVLYNNTSGDSVVIKTGTALSTGRQAVYFRSQDRSSWADYPDGNAQIRILKNNWDSGIFSAITLRKDGHVTYYDPAIGNYVNFGTYNDNEWTSLEFEWRSSDKKVRYRVGNDVWTDWKDFNGSGSYSNFDTVGFDFVGSGSGGLYVDNLQ